MESQLPKLLQEYRLRHKLTQQKLAEILYTDQSYISRIESGERPGKASDIDFVRRVSDTLSIEPEKLGLSGKRKMSRKSAPRRTRFRRGKVSYSWRTMYEVEAIRKLR